MAQVQEKTQRRQFLADHLAASRKVLAAHSINTTEFDDRKAEHQELASSIEALRQVYDLIVGLHGARLQTAVNKVTLFTLSRPVVSVEETAEDPSTQASTCVRVCR